MRRIFVLSFAFACGCSGGGISGTADGGQQPDLFGVSYAPATIHDVDVDPGNGPFGNGKHVLLRGVVAVTAVDKYVNSTNQQCRYQVWVQDPACTTPPCGLVVKAIGPMAPSPTSTGKDCPAARLSGTLLDAIRRGDNVTVRGKVVFEPDSLPPMKVVEHQLFVEAIEPLANDKTISPLALVDPASFGQFVTHEGTGWKQFEGMYVVLQPSVGTLQVSAIVANGFVTDPGKTNWGDTFDNDYIPQGVVSFPSQGDTFHSIAGVVSARHGGEIMPLVHKDFTP